MACSYDAPQEIYSYHPNLKGVTFASLLHSVRVEYATLPSIPTINHTLQTRFGFTQGFLDSLNIPIQSTEFFTDTFFDDEQHTLTKRNWWLQARSTDITGDDAKWSLKKWE
jgi:hypothetical protein